MNSRKTYNLGSNLEGVIRKVLPKEYFLQEDVVFVARDLLGKVLFTNINGQKTSGIIVETEAYRGWDDKACHAYKKRTSRTETMYKEGGIAYVYLCYGIHHLFNIVVGPDEVANAVLIRAIEPLDGIDHMHKRRRKDSIKNLVNGPGKLSQALGINTSMDSQKLYYGHGTIKIEQLTTQTFDLEVESSKRIGIDYAEECKDWPWRFTIKGSPWLSS